MRYRFGEFVLDRETGQLLGPDGLVTLRRQAWRLLLELLEQAPSLVERDELLDRIWGRTALSPNALPQTISELRQVLGDQARAPRYIETSHGRGYRLVCDVDREEDSPAPEQAASVPVSSEPAASTRRPSLLLPAAVVALGLFAVLLAWLVRGPDPESVAENSTGSHAASVESLQRQAEVARARHDRAAVAASLRALSLLDPGNEALMIDLVEAELDALEGESARRNLALLATRPALRRDPRWLVLKSRLARIDGDREQAASLAEAALAQARAHDQSVTGAAQLLASIRQEQGDMIGAETILTQVLSDEAIELSDSARAELVLLRLINLRERGELASARELGEQLADMPLDSSFQKRVAIEDALLLASSGDPASAWEQLELIQSSLPDNPDPDLAIALHNARGTVGMDVGKVDQAIEAFDRGFALARRSGRGYRMAGLQVNAGSLMARSDRFDDAERLWSAALQVFEQVGDRRGQAVCLGNLAAAASAQGRNQRSQELNQQALAIFRDLDLTGPRARTAFNLALVASREGHLDEAEELLTEAQDGYQRAGQTELVLHVGAFRADHRILAGDLITAESLLAELESLLDQGSPLRRAAVHASRGRLALWRGDLAGARTAFHQALSLRQDSGQDSWIATSELELLQVDLLAGEDPWRVRIRAEELADLFVRRDQIRAAARARLVVAEALMSQGAVVEARQVLSQIKAEQEQFSDMALALDLAWVEAWAAREEERLPRLEALARRAVDHGYYGKLTQIEAGLSARELRLEQFDIVMTGRSGMQSYGDLVALLPPYAANPVSLTSRE